MFQGIFARLAWVARRRRLQKEVAGFQASFRSMVDTQSHVGRYCKLAKNAILSKSVLGDFSYVSADTVIRDTTIGKFCSIGPQALVGGLGRHPTKWLSLHPAFYSTRGQASRTFVRQPLCGEVTPTSIGHDVWIGARAIILDGASIGNGAVIAAGAVVAGIVEPYSIVGGVPAKLIRRRFSNDVCGALEELAWWDTEYDCLELVAPLFTRTETWGLEDIENLRREMVRSYKVKADE